MSIKSELKSKYQQAKLKEEQEKKEKAQDLQAGARSFIENFIIPKFRKISEEKPTEGYLYIIFTNNIGCWRYTSNIDRWDSRKNSPYTYETVSAAVEIAKEFEIEASEKSDGAGGTSLSFWLDLD